MSDVSAQLSGAIITAVTQVRDNAEVQYATVRDRIVQEDKKRHEEEHQRQILAQNAEDPAASTSSQTKNSKRKGSKTPTDLKPGNGTSSQQNTGLENNRNCADESHQNNNAKANGLKVSPELRQTINAAERIADEDWWDVFAAYIPIWADLISWQSDRLFHVK